MTRRPYEFYKNRLVGRQTDGRTDRQNGDIVSITFPFTLTVCTRQRCACPLGTDHRGLSENTGPREIFVLALSSTGENCVMRGRFIVCNLQRIFLYR
jgi:hypothetical protein